MVRKERLELSQVTPLVPKTSASTNSATFAIHSELNLPPSQPGTLHLQLYRLHHKIVIFCSVENEKAEKYIPKIANLSLKIIF